MWHLLLTAFWLSARREQMLWSLPSAITLSECVWQWDWEKKARTKATKWGIITLLTDQGNAPAWQNAVSLQFLRREAQKCQGSGQKKLLYCSSKINLDYFECLTPCLYLNSSSSTSTLPLAASRENCCGLVLLNLDYSPTVRDLPKCPKHWSTLHIIYLSVFVTNSFESHHRHVQT